MSNLLDIGRSGILAYRTALAVTAENVANVGTEGYRRRDVSTVAMGGARATPVSAPSGGQGVGVADIRRAFDALATDRARSATADQAAAQSHLNAVRAMETQIIPGDDGIDGTLRQFFDSLGALAGNPTDPVTRTQTLRQGEALADGLSGLARDFGVLRQDLLTEAGQVLSQAKELLGELADLSRRMLSPSDTNAAVGAAMHPLADMRDMMLDKLSSLVPVSVALDTAGRPTIRFGHEAGPLILERDRPASLELGQETPLTVLIRSDDGNTRETRLLSTAMLGGLARGLSALDMAVQELDSFARDFVQTVNGIHRGGIDLNGDPGRDLFALEGWQVLPSKGNTGRVHVAVQPFTTDVPRQPVELLFDGAAGLWRATNPEGIELASGAETLLLPSGRIDLVGVARDGDRINLRPVTGRAEDLRWALRDQSALAAASTFATASVPTNTGTARLTATMQPLTTASLPTLTLLPAAPALELLGGALGVVPAGSQNVELASLGRSAGTVIPFPVGADRLALSVDGAAHSFNFPDQLTAGSLAHALNGSELRSQDGKSLSSLGLVASAGSDGSLFLSRPGSNMPVEAVLGAGGVTETGLPSLGQSAGGTIQIISRNGQHIAGAPLSAAQAASLLTPANGFLPGAVYDPSPLIATSGVGYRATEISVFPSSSGHTAFFTSPEPVVGASLPLPSLAARQLVYSDATGSEVSINLPLGASASLISNRLSAAIPGTEATAVTSLELSGFSAGTVQFGLTGANDAPLTVSAMLNGSDANPLALAINAVTGSTGIRAEVSPNGDRLMLVQSGGHDITLSSLVTDAALGLVSKPVTPQGLSLGQPVTWGEGAALRQGGQVRIDSAQPFNITEGNLATGSFANKEGDVSVKFSAAGTKAILSFADNSDLAEGGQLYRLALAGQTIETAHAPGTSGPVIAASIAAGLRAIAPDVTLTGQSLPKVPPDGSTLVLNLEGASYTLKIEQGSPVVTGPEAGRLSASFDLENRLVISANGTTDSAGIRFSPSSAFGLETGTAVLRFTGKPPDPALLPADVTFHIGGQAHVIGMTATPPGLVKPPLFPGTASVDPVSGALNVMLSASADELRINAAAGTGMAGPGVAVRLQGGDLVLTGASDPLDLEMSVVGALGQSLRLSNLPPEDLVVLMTGSGTLRLAGSIETGSAPVNPGALDVVVTDALRGLVSMQDSITGDIVARGVLDPSGRVTLGGVALQLGGVAASGDRFKILPALVGTANADTAHALAALRSSNPATGQIGMTDRFATLQAGIGMQVAAAGRSLATAGARADAAQRAQAAIGDVDLDTQAARLLELQQAYQANAQSMTIARDLFDTILKMF